MLFEQKIKYMEYRESGTKVKGAGFVKLERWGEAWNVLLQISGLPVGCTGEKGVYFCGGRKEVLVGLISMEQGRGRLELQEDDTQDPAEDGIRFAEAERIRIPIGPEKEVVGILREAPAAGGVESRKKTLEDRESLMENRENLMEDRESLTESRESLMENREGLTESRENPIESRESLMDSQEKRPESRESLIENRESLAERQEKTPEGKESLIESREKLTENWEKTPGNQENLAEDREKLLAGEGAKKALTEENPGDPVGAEDWKGPSEALQDSIKEEHRETPDVKIREEYAETPELEKQDQAHGQEKQNQERQGLEKQGLEKQGREDPSRKMQGTRSEPSLQATSREKEAVQENPQPYVFQAALQPDKWEQLRSIYPSVRPFGDDREYLRISPGDFVILKDRSYRLANNSFLLHGYFNYKHLILHRSARQGETLYFVGVPGNFYDKEKEVAILFGFESFECAREPAKEGDYGYYMMRVEL